MAKIKNQTQSTMLSPHAKSHEEDLNYLWTGCMFDYYFANDFKKEKEMQ